MLGLKKVYEEKTKNWFFIFEINSFNDDGEHDVSDHPNGSMDFKNILTFVTPWTYRSYELSKNIIGVEFDYEYNGTKNYSSKCYGITITREFHIHLSWGVYEKDHSDVGFFRIFEPWFTSRTRTTHNLLTPSGEMWDENPECCNEKWDNHPAVTFEAKDYDGEPVDIKATMSYSRYTFFENKISCFFTKLLKLDDEHYSVNFDFKTRSGNGIGEKKESWKGGTVGHSIKMKNKNESIEDATKRYCLENNMAFIGEKK